jgi:predicted protein tyrosine phosphatase
LFGNWKLENEFCEWNLVNANKEAAHREMLTDGNEDQMRNSVVRCLDEVKL